MTTLNLTSIIVGTLVSVIVIVTSGINIMRALKKKWLQDEEQLTATRENTKAIHQLSERVEKLERKMPDAL